MRRLFIIALLLNITLILGGSPQPARAAIIVVDGTTCTLTDAILAANTGATVGGCTGSGGADVITLNATVTLTSADSTNSTLLSDSYAGLPDITSDITIQAGTATIIERDSGLGCVVDDANQFRVFNINGVSASLTLDGIDVRNGCASPFDEGRGGAIYVADGDLSLQNSWLTNNQAIGPNAFGGAIYANLSATTVLIHNTSSSNNAVIASNTNGLSAFAMGGVLYAESTSGTFTITDSSFTNNLAQGSDQVDVAWYGDAYGGALVLQDCALCSVSDSIFTGNMTQGGDANNVLGDAGALLAQVLS